MGTPHSHTVMSRSHSFTASLVLIAALSVCRATEGTTNAVARFRLNTTVGLVTLTREQDSEVQVSGEISGLDVGQYALLLVSLPVGGCEDVGGAVERAELYSWDQGSGETVTIHQTGVDCQQGQVLQCADLSWTSTQVSWQILVVIGVAVLLLLLILICIPLICYCVRRSRRKRAEDDLDDEYEDRSKSPMYDELSLPFIDASLPPTPRVGRIVNGLDILLGHGVSENSLVDKKSQVQW